MTDAEKLKVIINDPILWMETFGNVPTKQGNVVKFKMTPQQRYLAKKKQKYNIVLKSRQLGISTWCMLYSIYLALTRPNVTCLMMSDCSDSVSSNFSKLRAIYDYLPDYVKLKETANNRTQLAFENHSKVICCICGAKDKARGSTIAFAHISEAGLCDDENLTSQLVAIEQALVPGGTMVIESTAKGINKFHELWSKAVNEESNYLPFFFPWYKDKIMFADEYVEFSELWKARKGHYLTEEELDETEQWLLERGATLQMLMWRRIKIMNTGEDAFKQEFPSTPEEAFLNSDGANIFDVKCIYDRLINLDKYTSILKIPNTISIVLKQNKRYLKIWKYPIVGERYYVGCDSAEGLGGEHDYSVIEVLDKDGFQCAEFRSNKIKPYAFAEILYEMARYYDNALICIERASAGITIIEKLRDTYRYQNLMKYKSFDARGKTIRKWGWETSQTSKPKMINAFVELFETGGICINSKELLNEMKLFQSDGGKMSAVSGHDDCVMSMALAIVAFLHRIHYKTLTRG